MARTQAAGIGIICRLALCTLSGSLLLAVAAAAAPSRAASPPPAGKSLPRPTPQAPPPAPPSPPPSGDEATPDLHQLLSRLAEKAKVYESVALKFVCIESIRTADNSNNVRKYDYMYLEAEEQRYLPYRQRHTGRPGRTVPDTTLDLAFPDSYSWTLMFLPGRQHLFHFHYLGQEWFSLRLAHIIEFTAPLPFTSGKTVYEWSGKVWIDAENYNFLKVEAEPGNQEERLKLEIKEYRQAPRFLVFPMARRPRGAYYNITFLNEFQKLSLPDQAEYRQFSMDLEGGQEWEDLMTLRYAGYQFFDVNVKDKYLK